MTSSSVGFTSKMSLQALFEASLSPDQAARTQAETALSTNVSATQLVQFIKTSSSGAHRQSALIYLKNYVLHHWSTQFSEFRGPLCPEEERHVLRHESFSLIGDQERNIRVQAGFIVSKLIGSDYPDEWATVLDDLMGILAKPQNECWLHGALVVMKGGADIHFSHCGADLMLKLWQTLWMIV